MVESDPRVDRRGLRSSVASSVLVDGPRLRRISQLAVPMIASALVTNLMTVADTLMIGQLGDAALGGVGLAGQLFFLLLAVALGLSAAVQAMVARRVGEGLTASTGLLLNAGLVIGVLLGLLLVLIGYVALPPVMALINDDPEVIGRGWSYLSARLPSLAFIALNLVFRAYWVGVSLAKWAMVSIVTLSLANVLFNYLLIFGNFGAPRMGVTGAGLGSTLAVLVGTLLNIAFAVRLVANNGFLRGLPAKSQALSMVRIAYPESLRQVLFSLGVVCIYVLVGQIGTQQLAAFHVVISICLIAYLPHIGFGAAATTLVGEALGRKQRLDAQTWGWQVSSVGLVTLLVVALGVAGFPTKVLGWFLLDEATLVLAVVPLQLAVFAHAFDGYGKVVGSALVGAGATKTAMWLTVLPQWGLLLPLLAISVSLGNGLAHAMGVVLMVAMVSALLFVWVWHAGRWGGVEV